MWKVVDKLRTGLQRELDFQFKKCEKLEMRTALLDDEVGKMPGDCRVVESALTLRESWWFATGCIDF